jgi:hypothetical protein
MQPVVIGFQGQGQLADGRTVRADAHRNLYTPTSEQESVRVGVDQDAGGEGDGLDVGIVANQTAVEERTEELPLVRTDGDGTIWVHDATLAGPEDSDEVGHLEATVSMVATCPDDDGAGD